MKILVTGAKGFVGKNLCAQLNNIKEGKAKCYGDLTVSAVYEYDIDSTIEDLDKYCSDCDFVFNLAGVNRPQSVEEFMEGNFGFASTLLAALEKHGNKCPVMLSSSLQATLIGRYADGEYGKSKKAGEELFFVYRAISAPSEKLILTCSALSSDGSSQRQSLALVRLKKLMPTLKEISAYAKQEMAKSIQTTIKYIIVFAVLNKLVFIIFKIGIKFPIVCPFIGNAKTIGIIKNSN